MAKKDSEKIDENYYILTIMSTPKTQLETATTRTQSSSRPRNRSVKPSSRPLTHHPQLDPRRHPIIYLTSEWIPVFTEFPWLVPVTQTKAECFHCNTRFNRLDRHSFATHAISNSHANCPTITSQNLPKWPEHLEFSRNRLKVVHTLQCQ